MIVDSRGRRFRNLRVSLTAACNYACTYCVPNGRKLMAARDELGVDELRRATQLLIDVAGIEKVRITGGEPLIASSFDGFARALQDMPLEDVAITTNGQFLIDKLPVLLDSPIGRINLSLDTLNPLAFRRLARGGDLYRVLEGLEEALKLGFGVKVNMVPVRSANLDQVVPLLDYCLERDIELRMIELMNMGHLKHSSDYHKEFVGMDELLEIISERYEFERTDAPYDSTAVRFSIEGEGSFGIIANHSQPFCASCTRLRLSSDGNLYGCLSSRSHHPIRDLLALPEDLAKAQLSERLSLALGDKQPLAFSGEVTVMKFIGG